MFDRKRTHFSNQLTKQVATGETVADEGCILVISEESGIEKVKLSTGAASETVIGFSMIDKYQPTTRTVCETGSVPHAAPFTVNLGHTNLVTAGAGSTQIRVVDSTLGSDLTQVAGVPAAAEFAVVASTGVVTFNAARADDVIAVYYKYNLTVQESRMIFHDRHANAGASAEWGVVEVGTGQGEIWTDRYDVTKSYAGLTAGQLVCGANGLFTTGAAGTAFGRVIHAPTTSLPLLGVAFTVQNLIAQ